ncbi:hypothetical protein DM860_000175 [Cuscuta australis]|uniref:GATA-type domain-containing protein n=1 Tax=Cuscuta australis TaxID=267555 RepID=A0A328CYT1_9ASTE|nr:hypothetical protein DM860_000175 [Cuscuta australis]
MSVVESGCLDGITNGCDNFPDLLNILDFPEEDSLEGDELLGDWDADLLQSLGPIPSDALMLSPPLPKPNVDNRSLRTAFKSKAFNHKEETSGATLLYPSTYFEGRKSRLFQTQSPISVLESTIPIKPDLLIPVRTRSRRARPTLNPWTLIPPPVPPASRPRKKRRARKMMSSPSSLNQGANSSDQQPSGVRRCAHCQVTKTPQWREGPAGPTTLCNACGVRYRSGRLFPEYRPVASPTFVPELHSNSHRKVVEMRRRAGVEGTTADGQELKMV